MNHKIESSQVHYRNDKYSIFSKYNIGTLVNMDEIEQNYLVLPLHSKVTLDDVDFICDVIEKGW